MAVFRPHSVTLFADGMGAAVHVPDIIRYDFPLNPEIMAELTGSRTRPSHAAITAIRPVMTFSTYAVDTVLDEIDGGLAIDTDTNSGVTLNIAKLDDYGDPLSGGAHRGLTILKGVCVPVRLAADHRGDFVLDCAVYPIQKSTSELFTITKTLTLPTLTVTSVRYTLGPIDLVTVVMSDYTGVVIDFGFQINPIGTQSEPRDKYIGPKNNTPSIELNGKDLEWLDAAVIPVSGAAAAHANSNLYLRKRAIGTAGFVADGTAEHIKVTYAGVATILNAVSAQASQAADTSLRIEAFEDSSGNAPLIITTASAIT